MTGKMWTSVTPGSPLDVALKAAADCHVIPGERDGRWTIELTEEQFREVLGAVAASARLPFARARADLEDELAGYQSATNKNQAELGRIVGLQDALAIVRKATGR